MLFPAFLYNACPCFGIKLNLCHLQAAKGAGVPVILDAGGKEGPVPVELIKLVDIFSPNETELARLTGMPTETFEQISHAAKRIHEKVRSMS